VSLSFGEAAACAANASAAVELLADGARAAGVLHGLADGERLCELLECGMRARTNRESFSAAGLAAGEFVGLVISSKTGEALVSKISGVLGQMRQIRYGLTPGPIQLEELRDYFYALTRVLSHQGALRRRLTRDLEPSW
jgi:hypothetical protein